MDFKGSKHRIYYRWSIDRITIVGTIKKVIKNGEKDLVGYTMDKIGEQLEKNRQAEKVSDGWVIKDEYGENVAYINKPKFGNDDTGRIDFNPNKLLFSMYLEYPNDFANHIQNFVKNS